MPYNILSSKFLEMKKTEKVRVNFSSPRSSFHLLLVAPSRPPSTVDPRLSNSRSAPEMNRQLEDQCRLAKTFPVNVARFEGPAHPHEGRLRRLDDHAGRLFCGQDKSKLKFYEFNNGSQGG